MNKNPGGGGSHQLDQFVGGESTKLGIVYLMEPKAETFPEHLNNCKAKILFHKGIVIEYIVIVYDTNGRKVQDPTVRKAYRKKKRLSNAAPCATRAPADSTRTARQTKKLGAMAGT